jgi:hypothetical protein
VPGKLLGASFSEVGDSSILAHRDCAPYLSGSRISGGLSAAERGRREKQAL